MAEQMPYPGDSLARLQAAELDILRVIRDVCQEHGITYWLDGGTCLGAVRHGGFIPWDDDGDVAMPQEDYERFLRIAPDALPEGYTLHTWENTPGMSALWAKVEIDGTRFIDTDASEAGCAQGIYVDVFCYRRLDEDDREMNRQIRQSSLYQRLSFLNATEHPHISKSIMLKSVVQLGVVLVHRTIAKAWTPQRMAEQMERAWQSPCPGNRMANDCYAYMCWQEKDTLLPTGTIEFEGEEFACPAKPEVYLERLYGDWRQLPPEDERYKHAPLVLDFGDGVNVMEATPEVAEERPEDVPKASSPSYPPGVLARIQATELDMLKVLDNVCKEMGIEYWLDGGTALGAARHQGFIPWDDDADVGMSMQDYDRFVAVAPSLLPEGYSLHTCENTEGYYFFWARLEKDETRFVSTTALKCGRNDGIFVDIFPMVRLDEKNPYQRLKRAVFWQRMSLLHHLPYPEFQPYLPHRELYMAAGTLAHNTVARLWDSPRMHQEFRKVWEAGTPGTLWHNASIGIGKGHEEGVMFPLGTATFEGLELPVPHDLDAYLTDIYGDWRQLPPSDRRVTHAPLIVDFGDGVNVMEGWQA